MTSSNLAHGWLIEPCAWSLEAPHRVTDESWQTCISPNAQLSAQPADLHLGLAGPSDSLEAFSTLLPNLDTE